MTEEPSTIPLTDITIIRPYCTRLIASFWLALVWGAAFLYTFSCRYQQYWHESYCVSQKAVLLCRHNTQCKKSTLNMLLHSIITHLRLQSILWSHKYINMKTPWIHWQLRLWTCFVGTVYNKWGRCVSIKYSLLWYNHTKYEKKNPVICWRKTLIFKWLYNKNKWWGISCIHTLLWLYIQVDWWGICIQEES